MALSGSRLNTARVASVLADLQTQFPVDTNLLAAEKTAYAAAQQKVAHAMADHESDVVDEITGHAIVNPSTLAITPSNIKDGSTLACSGNGLVTTGTGTVS